MRYYFLGICGTAMASLAVLLKQSGHKVWGTDQNAYPPMSELLEANHIPLWEGYDPAHLDRAFDVVVVGNALSRGNPEVETLLNRRLPFASLPEIIRREFAAPKKSIVVTGTHGKTTITALVSWMLETAGLAPTFLIGGISKNFNTSARLSQGDYFVVEGDEYDSAFFDKRPKFLHYLPYYLIINNIEYDHSDIYRNVDQIKEEFRKLMRSVPGEGVVVANGEDPAVRDVISPVYSRLQVFGSSSGNDWHFGEVETNPDGTSFTVFRYGEKWERFFIPFHGDYQLSNALAAIAVAADIGLTVQQIRNALKNFSGVKRRIEFCGDLNGAPFYEDFAHHPTAIRMILRALRSRYPNRRLLAIFEPRTNTTVKNIFQSEIAEALSQADVSILSPIHRPENIPLSERLSLAKLETDLRQMNKSVHILPDYQSLLPLLRNTVSSRDVIVLMTNGNFGGEYGKIKQTINSDEWSADLE